MACSGSLSAWTPARSGGGSRGAASSCCGGERRGCAAAALTAAWLLAATQAAAGDWPQWRGPSRNGKSEETNWLATWPPTLVWTQSVGEGYSSVTVSEGQAYTLGHAAGRDTVYSFDAVTGAKRWDYSYACGPVNYDGPRATPTVHGQKLYTYSQEGHLHCFDKHSGKLLWQKLVNRGRPTWGLAGSPLVDANLIVLNAGGNGVAIRASAPYDTVWTSDGIAAYSSPVALNWAGRRLIVLFTDAGVVGVDRAAGTRRWWFPWVHSYNIPDPVPYNDKLFVACGYADFCALLRLANGELKPVWQNQNLRIECCTPVLIGDNLYGFDNGETLRCIDIRDGKIQWSADTLGFYEGGLIAADGKLIVLGDSGALAIVRASPTRYILDRQPIAKILPGAGTEEWSTAPVLANGRLYCRSTEGTVVCLQVGVDGAAFGRGRSRKSEVGSRKLRIVPENEDPDSE